MEAVQVVRICEETGSYVLDEAALARVLLAPGVADRPVAVVSVAGAYRGGKSFLLNYFLRYLQAEPRAQADGSWIGGATEPLRGFNWRGGSERDTTGLVMMPQPVQVRLPTGQEAAVLLVDTQGAFDWSSSMRDCSTVFAMSALVSSVQVYNVARDIQADALHHLQLFTEYARLAVESGDAPPFQWLQFVIRDWGHPSEHPYGADGGSQLLRSRFRLLEETSEIQGLWQNIRQSFNKVRCFLMPYPGSSILQQQFNGCRSELCQEFTRALKELAPAILAPENLTLKRMGGQLVTGRELYEYFRTYIALFNSDQLPTPVTIFQATAQAGLAASEAAARAHFRRAMADSCGGDRPSVSRESLRACHRNARDSALQAFSERRTLADTQEVENRRAQLTQEFNDELPTFELLNEAKISRGIAQAEAVYASAFRRFGMLELLCLHPVEFEELHQTSIDAAVVNFNNTRIVPEGAVDEDLDTLKANIARERSRLFYINKENNELAVRAAKRSYGNHMDYVTATGQLCLHPRDLLWEHDKAKAESLSELHHRRRRQSDRADDPYASRIISAAEDRYNSVYKCINAEKNKAAIQTVMNTFKEEMTIKLATSLLTPTRTIELATLLFDGIYTECKEEAIAKFHRLRRPLSPHLNYDDDVYLDQLKREIDTAIDHFREEIKKAALLAAAIVVGAAVTGL